MNANQGKLIWIRGIRGSLALLHVFGLLAVVPRIILVGETHAVCDGGVVPVPEHQETVRIRINKGELT